MTPSTDNIKASELSIKDPFTFEFLGLEAKDAVSESDLEQALMDHLQEFMLELGEGFCFEARQKRIIIDDKYYFIDLVFYNRLLHCSVIIELKNDEFKHEDLGQLNSYVGYYKKNEMAEGDNPPVGILLCTDKGSEMVEYALSGMDNKLFVSTYMLHLPDKKKLQEFMLKEMKEMGISRLLYGKFGEKVDLTIFMMGSGAMCLVCYLVAGLSGIPLIGLIGFPIVLVISVFYIRKKYK